MSFSPLEIGIILLVVILLFGTRRLPELGSGLGKAISNFKKSYKDSQAIDITPRGDDAIDDAHKGGSQTSGVSSKKEEVK